MFKLRSRLPEPVSGKVAGITVSQFELPRKSGNDTPPPSYSATASQESPPDVTTAFASLNLNNASNPTQTPTPDQCLAHLKLLEAFYSLREGVSNQDGLFGIKDSYADVSSEHQRPESLARIREKRWQVYIFKATKRFESWWKDCVMPTAQRQTQYAVTTVTQSLWAGQCLNFESLNLPPLGK